MCVVQGHGLCTSRLTLRNVVKLYHEKDTILSAKTALVIGPSIYLYLKGRHGHLFPGIPGNPGGPASPSGPCIPSGPTIQIEQGNPSLPGVPAFPTGPAGHKDHSASENGCNFKLVHI